MSIPPWKEALGLHGRGAPELYERGQAVRNSPYAEEIRKAMDELNLTAMFCVENVPQTAILEQAEYDSEQISEVHAALWNQGLASILVVMGKDSVRVFSLARAPGSGDLQQFESQCLINTLDAAAAAISLKDYIYGVESGRLWHEKSEYFNPKERIDSVLLENLTAAHDFLTDAGLSDEEAQAILMQTMFIAYLEDRGITTSKFFKNVSGGEQQTLSDILASGDADLLARLFNQLRQDFNGDLFVAPCSFDNPDHPRRLKAEAMNILLRFRKGKEEMAEKGGQLRFWGYNFKFIPVELISAVYDRFLGHNKDTRHETGAYYTPMFLVDTVISSVWDKVDDRIKAQGTVLDPACGSGIFLVRTFQRFCEHWRQNAKVDTIRWDSLVKMLQRVQGRDLNGTAVRVAVFSLYIALLEEVSPPDIQRIAAKGRLLPPLWNKTLVQRDFFDEDAEALQVDVIVGNPPWVSRRGTKGLGADWCIDRNLPIPNREEAWAFTWKALDHLTNQGATAFLLPAMGFLHNHATSSVNARLRFFKETRVSRVVNFSDLRHQLFDGASFPTALIVFQRDSHLDNGKNYKFDYWTPKADLNLAIRRFVTLSTLEKSKIHLSNVCENPSIFKQRLWMRPPEAKLFNYLDALPKIGSFVITFRSSKRRDNHTDRSWIIGQGFQPYKDRDVSLEPGKSYKSKIVANCKYLPIKGFTPVSIDTTRLSPFGQSIVRRRGFEGGFVGPRVLMPCGVAASPMRLRAAYVEEPVTFQHIMQAIAAPVDETEKAKFMTAILNSRLVVWYSFHGASSLGSSRSQVHQSEFLKLPLPEPEHLASPKNARTARKKLVSLVDSYPENYNKVSRSSDEDERFLRKIDLLTYTYFGLSNEEITLIEDAVEHILPAIHPSAGSFPNLWKPTTRKERANYANQLATSLSDWFHEKRLSVRLVGYNEDFGILRLQLQSKVNANTDGYTENADTSFSEALGNIADALNRPIAQNFQTVPDLKIFVEESLFLIKPMQRRFWLKSAALADADGIASELETTIALRATQGAVS